MKKIFFCMAVTAMMLFSCSSGVDKQKVVTDSIAATPNHEEQLSADDKTNDGQDIPIRAANMDWDKKIIKTADINIETKNYTLYGEQLHKRLKAYRAYFTEEKQQLTEFDNRTTMVIKVPADQFDALVNSLAGDSAKILEKKISSEEVTGEMIDTQSRIQARKIMRDRYYDLLRQAKNMKEILEVQQAINTLQESLESAGGRLSYLQHSAAYSTINLSYFQLTENNTTNTGRNSYLVRAKNAFISGASITSDLLIILLQLWPLILLIIAACMYFKKKPRIVIK